MRAVLPTPARKPIMLEIASVCVGALPMGHVAVRLLRLASIMWLRMLWSTGAPPEMRSKALTKVSAISCLLVLNSLVVSADSFSRQFYMGR